MNGGTILLAAGYSRRFGSDKRRHRLADGTPLLIASARLYAHAFARLIVVLRPEDDELAELLAAADLQAATEVLRCPDAHRGMGNSLAWGARGASAWDYAFVALGDMAWVRPATLDTLRDALADAGPRTIVQPTFQSRPGHPVGFGRHWLPALARLEGDAGARSILRADGAEVRQLPVTDPGVLEDLDTPPG